LNDEGNAFFSGTITAVAGSIGGFNIGGNNDEGYPIDGLWYGDRGKSGGFYVIPSGTFYSDIDTSIAG
jgi:hypothetical protein